MYASKNMLQKIKIKSPRRKSSSIEDNKSGGTKSVSDIFNKMKMMSPISPHRKAKKCSENESFTTKDVSESAQDYNQTDMLKVTVSITKLNGILSDSNLRRPSFGGMNPFRSSTTTETNGFNAEQISPTDSSDSECIFAVVSVTHDALGCVEPVVTRFSSQPLQDPTSIVGSKSKYTARWANRLLNAANNASVSPSITFPKMMSLTSEHNTTFQYEPKPVEFSVGIMRQNEMITLGTAKLVITEPLEEVTLRLPLSHGKNVSVRNPAMIQSIIDKIKNLKKKKILANLYEKEQHMSLVKDMPNGVFESRPTRKFMIENEASLEITVTVSRVDIPTHRTQHDNEDDFTIITAYNSSSKTFPYEEYVIKFKENKQKLATPPRPPQLPRPLPSPQRSGTNSRRNDASMMETTPSVVRKDASPFSIVDYCCMNSMPPISPSATPDYEVTDASFDLDTGAQDLSIWNKLVGSGDVDWNPVVDESFTAVSDYRDAVPPRRSRTVRRNNNPNDISLASFDDDVTNDYDTRTNDRSFTSFSEGSEYYGSYTDDDSSDEETFETGLTALSSMSEYSLGPNTMYSVVHAKKILAEYSRLIGKDPKQVMINDL